MSNPLAGGISTKTNPQSQFRMATSGAAAPPVPWLTIPVEPEATKKIVLNLDRIKGRTDDSNITKETTPAGATRYSFMDTRNNQPLAVMNTENGRTSLALYKSPEDLAKRIDSVFVKADDIKQFIDAIKEGGTNYREKPARSAALTPQ